ncbi:MAG: hypothetical protein AB7G28_21890 [Pirellulales bacterium]
MSIQFACPKCARGYRVKDELAGKSAKCGQCGHKMSIPAAATKAVAASTLSAAKSASPQSKSVAAKPTAAAATSKPTAAKSLAANVAATPAAKAKPVAPKADAGTSSWLDEELETARVAAKAKPVAPPRPSDASCPSCNAPVTPGAVICVKCGYDKRIRGRRSVERVDEDAAAPQRTKLGHVGSLLRGSFFSFLGAMLGAIIWAVLCYATMYEFSVVAWGLGGLAGLGMALGHEDDDGTFAGIIAAFMSVLGIVAAKVFIVVIFVAAAVSAMVSEMPLEADGQGFDVVSFQRAALADATAMKELEASGENLDTVSDERWEQLLEKAKGDVADLSPAEVEARLNEFGDEERSVSKFAASDEVAAEEDFADENDAADADHDDAALADAELQDDEAPTFGSVVGSLFGPIDGLWILLAFFTAYKVGAGQSGD